MMLGWHKHQPGHSDHFAGVNKMGPNCENLTPGCRALHGNLTDSEEPGNPKKGDKMILNLTQHPATAEQLAAGVIDLKGDELAALKSLLTINDLPTRQELVDRAHDIAAIVAYNGLGGDDDDPIFAYAMIGGAPYLMPALERALSDEGITPLYAFTRREAVEETRDGKVVKTAIFRHLGFVEGTI
jgi:hypothetical protein